MLDTSVSRWRQRQAYVGQYRSWISEEWLNIKQHVLFGECIWCTCCLPGHRDVPAVLLQKRFQSQVWYIFNLMVQLEKQMLFTACRQLQYSSKWISHKLFRLNMSSMNQPAMVVFEGWHLVDGWDRIVQWSLQRKGTWNASINTTELQCASQHWMTTADNNYMCTQNKNTAMLSSP